MSKFQVLITDHPWGDADVERRLLEPEGIEILEAPDDSEATLQGMVGTVDAIATCWAKVSRPVIDAAPRCRHIARMGIGLDNIDVEAASAREIVVTNVPDYCVEEVADHAMALILACVRNLAFFHHRIRQGTYSLESVPPMHRLAGRTLGLVGFGRIAREVAARARGFGLQVQATTPSGNDYGTGVRMVSQEELLATSDVVSLHAPLTEQTTRLIDEQALARMKTGAILVNTSRGGLIDQEALARAVHEGKIAAAGLDVFTPEPPDLGHPMFREERIVTTPHAAFISEESLTELRERVSQQILDVLQGRTPENVVNPPRG